MRNEEDPGAMNWRDEYQKKFVSPEDAVKVVQSGDTVAIPIDTEPWALSRALLNRKGELDNITVLLRRPYRDLGWFESDLGGSFTVVLDTQASPSAAMNQKASGIIPALTSVRFRDDPTRGKAARLDVVMIVVSPPDEAGYCSFGTYLTHKGEYARHARKVLAEVSSEPRMMVRVPGDGRIHVSEITFFTEHEAHPTSKRSSEAGPGEQERTIARYVASLIRDGDTLQVGPGAIAEGILSFGGLEKKRDLGIHSGVFTKPMLELIKKGIITGRRKNVNPNLSVAGGFYGIDDDDLPFIDGNSHFLVKDMSYVNDIRVIASHDNMVCINGVFAIDLSGQLAVERLGMKLLGGAGGQVEFVIGTALSKGGRSITVLRSTASGGRVSRILPVFEGGTQVNIPRAFTDYVVTEYGVASLWGKTERQRALELVSIAHPDFRAELRREAERLY